MASFAEKMAMWQNSSVPLTPEAQSRKLRQAKEQQANAVKIARARAARYNMTLRALSIQTIREKAEQKKQDLDAMAESRKRAEKYNMTSRAIAIASAKTQANVAKAMDPSVSPSVARKLVEAAATFQATAESDIKGSDKAQAKKAADVLGTTLAIEQVVEAAKESENGEEQDEQQEDEEEGQAAEEDSQAQDEQHQDDVIVMDELAAAVAVGDEQGVNRAILNDFLAEHAPERLDEVDELLKEYQGSKVEVLFQDLVAKYPDPAEASKKGEQRALAKAMRHTSVVGELVETGQSESEEDEEGDEEDEEDEDIDLVEATRREKDAAETREREKIASMSPEERTRYYAEKQAEKDHAAKKDAMLKSQLGLYAKNGAKKNPVLAGMSNKITSRSSVDKRLSKKLDQASSTAAKKSMAADSGFILSVNAPAPAAVASKEPKWAVDVQVNNQPTVLRERMKKAGVDEKDIDALLAEESDML